MATIRFDFCATPFGEVLLARSPAGVCHMGFTDGDRRGSMAELAAARPGARLVRHDLVRLAAAIFAQPGRPAALDLSGTPFQREVWGALLATSRGGTLSYAELARDLGRPRAARAVGRAVAGNRVALLVPCHRVLPRAGGIGHYRWGSARKAALLAWEAGGPV